MAANPDQSEGTDRTPCTSHVKLIQGELADLTSRVWGFPVSVGSGCPGLESVFRVPMQVLKVLKMSYFDIGILSTGLKFPKMWS